MAAYCISTKPDLWTLYFKEAIFKVNPRRFDGSTPCTELLSRYPHSSGHKTLIPMFQKLFYYWNLRWDEACHCWKPGIGLPSAPLCLRRMHARGDWNPNQAGACGNSRGLHHRPVARKMKDVCSHVHTHFQRAQLLLEPSTTKIYIDFHSDLPLDRPIFLCKHSQHGGNGNFSNTKRSIVYSLQT